MRRLAAAAALLLACATQGTPPAPPATAADPPVTEPEPPPAAARPTPWRIVYADGSANVYRFAQPSAGGLVSFEYVPVTPETSSTGQYSGGDPVALELSPDDARIDELWRRVDALAADTASHTDARAKGTGAFTLETPAGPRQFILPQGATLDAFHAFAAAFRR